MHSELSELIEAAIELELNVAELYLLFHRKLPEDAHFWWELAIEEENHAALLKTVRLMSENSVAIPMELFPASIEEMLQSNRNLRKAIEDFEQEMDRTKAFLFALEIEQSAGELHYNNYMKEAPESKLTEVFRNLNGADMDHAMRIRDYMQSHHIEG
jgi:hypothetical protein